MKIDYPVIEWDDVREGDTILGQRPSGKSFIYLEFPVGAEHSEPFTDATYYLIERPAEVFPEDYGTVIIAKKVRGIDFPDGVILSRQRGSSSSYTPVMWKSLGRKISGADNHSERQIEDWVLAKVVPA